MINDDTICLYNSKKAKPIVFLFREQDSWKENKMKTSLSIVQQVERKYKFVEKLGDKSFDIGDLNNMVGFMIHDPRYNIIYKTKELKMSSNKRIKKGVSCKRGQTKGSLITIINKLAENKDGLPKYSFGVVRGSKRNNINAIYSFSGENILMYEYDNSGKRMIHRSKPTNISTLQLCIEIELLFRYYNYTKKDNKIWFLSELEANINKIENVGI
jgi:phosphopantetheine adenylyltransferase